MSHNELHRISGVGGLQDLSQLSLESNLILSLAGLHQLSNLMELYVGNNCIASLSEIDYLKMLSKLIIVDLAGNPVCSDYRYRLYTLYRVRRLKVLDGTSVSTDEAAAAREKYSGRLTLEQVREKVGLNDTGESGGRGGGAAAEHHGHATGGVTDNDRSQSAPSSTDKKLMNSGQGGSGSSVGSGEGIGMIASPLSAGGKCSSNEDAVVLDPYAHVALLTVRVLDLSHQKLKDATALLEGGLQNLQDLNLDHNNITSFAALVTLPALIVLRLNHNKVDGCGSWSGLEGQGTPDAPALRIVSPLEVLLLGFNKVGHIDALGLQQFPRLRVLHLQSNNLSSLQGLGACPSLRELVLNKNRIRQLEAVSLSGLPNLHELHMQENGVRSLQHFSGLVSLQSLHLGYNRVNDVQDLSYLSELHQLVNIAMNNNPVARRQLYRPTLLCQVHLFRK